MKPIKYMVKHFCISVALALFILLTEIVYSIGVQTGVAEREAQIDTLTEQITERVLDDLDINNQYRALYKSVHFIAMVHHL